MNFEQICLLKMSQGDPKPDKSLNVDAGMNSKHTDIHVEWLLCRTASGPDEYQPNHRITNGSQG